MARKARFRAGFDLVNHVFAPCRTCFALQTIRHPHPSITKPRTSEVLQLPQKDWFKHVCSNSSQPDMTSISGGHVLPPASTDIPIGISTRTDFPNEKSSIQESTPRALLPPLAHGSARARCASGPADWRGGENRTAPLRGVEKPRKPNKHRGLRVLAPPEGAKRGNKNFSRIFAYPR